MKYLLTALIITAGLTGCGKKGDGGMEGMDTAGQAARMADSMKGMDGSMAGMKDSMEGMKKDGMER